MKRGAVNGKRRGPHELSIFRQNVFMSSLEAWADDAQFFHFGIQGRSLQTQNFGGATFAADPPAGLLQHGHNMLPLYILQVVRGVCFRQSKLGKVNDQGFTLLRIMACSITFFSSLTLPGQE